MRVIQIRQQIYVLFLISLVVMFSSLCTLDVWAEENNDVATATSTKRSKEVSAAQTTTEAKHPRISIRRTEETGDASLYIELNEVIKFRSGAAGLTPFERVKLVQERLQTFLRNGGNPRDIKPGQEGNLVVIRAGETALVTIDPETAKKANLSQKELAFQWTNMIRKAFGVDPIQRDIAVASSRSFTPALHQLRQTTALTGKMFQGYASWYGPGFHGRRTASGERFNMYAMTAAHKTLPHNTLVKVTNKWNGKSAVVRITDRGPFIPGRIIDLSKGAAQAIGMLSSGTAPVIVEVLGR